MRELLRVTAAAVAVLIVYFGYMVLIRPELPQGAALPARADVAAKADMPEAALGDTRALMQLLEEYRDQKGAYPVPPSYEISAGALKKLLASSGVAFRSPIAASEFDAKNRYVSVDGRSYGLLVRADGAQPAACLVEVKARRTGWWGQPLACAL
jgi:hypothetical protein